MESKYVILCEIGDSVSFNIAGIEHPVSIEDIHKEEFLNRITRIQFKQAPKREYLESVVKAIKKRPEIDLRFYGNYPEESIQWDLLREISSLSIMLWESNGLKQISKLTQLKSLAFTKLPKSKLSLSTLEPLQNLEKLYTDVTKNVESIRELKKLRFLSLSEIKNDNLDFLSGLNHLETLWLSLGSIKDFRGISMLPNLKKLQIHRVRGFDDEAANMVLPNCKNLWAIHFMNLKHVTSLDFVPLMPQIKYISFEGLQKLQTFAPISKSTTLEIIAGTKCRPEDKSLDGLRKLKRVALGDSYTKQEIESFLADNQAESIAIRGKVLKGEYEPYFPFMPGSD